MSVYFGESKESDLEKINSENLVSLANAKKELEDFLSNPTESKLAKELGVAIPGKRGRRKKCS